MAFAFIQSGGLLTVLSTDKSFYNPGESVRISLFKINVSPYPITFTYPTSQRYDFVVTGSLGEVWRWSADRVFLPVVETVTLYPGQTRSYVAAWPQVNLEGGRVQSGLYRVTGWNTSSEPVAFPRPSVVISIAG